MENNEVLTFKKLLEYIKTKKKLVIIFLIIMLTPLILLIITKMTPSSRSIGKLNKFSKEISSINDTFKKSVQESGINTDSAKSSLSLAIVNLNNIKIPLETIDVPNEVNLAKEQLLTTLNLNISVCEQSLSIFMNPSNNKLNDKLSQYKSKLDEFKDNNLKLSNFRINKVISEDSLEFFDKSTSYFNTMIKINIMKDITKEKNSDYVLAVEKTLNKFLEIKEDLKPALEDIKNNNRSLYVLIEDLENKKLIFENIKNDLYTLSIPEEAIKIHDLLKETVKYYDTYYSSLETMLYKDLKETNKLPLSSYDECFNNYNKFITSFDTFTQNLDLFKRN
ncbi:hypothetical protein [Clostridium sp. Ade.TY]|uniref:hypothetical protein n=1 Tax=Clostridium sp. Ade.TY TaxID=1391647 RepID=UPI0004647DEB|nr:hypothetical protein [Clostridium sp. Ade.TY]